MAVKKQGHCCEYVPKMKMFLGILFFVAGILRYLGYDWSIVMMAVGILLVLKGIILKLKK